MGAAGAQVVAMDGALGTVHAARAGAVAVVEQLAGQTGQHGALVGPERELRHGGAVLSEIDDERLAGVQLNRFAVGIFVQDTDTAELLVLPVERVLPRVGPHGLQGQVVAMIDFGAVGGQDLARELGVHLGCVQHGIVQREAGVVGLAVKDAGVGDWPGDGGAPLDGVGAEALRGAVGHGQLEHTAEGALVAHHALMAPGRDNLVGPPAGRHLHGQPVLYAGLQEAGRDVVGKGAAGLLHVCKTGLEHLTPDRLPVDVELIDAQGGGHPAGAHHLPVVREGRDKPARTVGRAAIIVVVDSTRDDGRIGH